MILAKQPSTALCAPANNAQRSSAVMHVESECQLRNAVNKMPQSRVWNSAIAGEQEPKTMWVRKANTFNILNLFHLLCFYFMFFYLRNHCHPCPRCRRSTGQTSAGQGLRCVQTVSVTDDTSLQITCEPAAHGKTAHCVICFFLCLFFRDE